jgi:serine/threonine kinase 38
VREKLTGKIMAMKKLKKVEMLRRGQVEHVKAERNVLAEVHNPFIVKLYYSFQVNLLCICVFWGGVEGGSIILSIIPSTWLCMYVWRGEGVFPPSKTHDP